GANLFAFRDEIVINEILYHPRPLPPTPAVFQETTLLPITTAWKYNQSGIDLGTAWRGSGFDDSGWPSGAALLFVEDGPLPAPKNTPLTLGRNTYYFRTTFLFTGRTNGLELRLHPVVDDGAVFYLNGEEARRINLDTDPIGYFTNASPGVSDATFTGPFTIPLTNLVSGTNVLAVEVHQASSNSTDIVFGTELLARTAVSPALPWRESPEAWIELYNRGANTVDLSGWELDRGIDYTFPPGTVMAPGAYLVATDDTNYLQSLRPGIPLIGNFTNRLSRHSDLIVLRDTNKNPVDEVRYYDDGRWPAHADGGGSSLELRSPLADNSKAEAWAGSDETGRSQWMTYSYQGVAAADPGPTLWSEFVLGLLNSGEVLLDDISVLESPNTAPRELIQNGSFESGATSWRIIGTHAQSSVIVDPANSANHVLHLTASGPAEHMHNHAETTLAGGATIVNGREYRISFRARWLAGSNHLNTRLYFNRLARTTLLEVPGPNGTPGARNSRFEGNVGPTFDGFRHVPVVPAANEPVTVSVVADDPQGVTACALWWSANGGAWNNLPMTAPGNRPFEGTIPGHTAGSVVQFYVEARDALGVGATFPARGANSRALYKVNDGQAFPGRLHNVRLMMTAADANVLHAPTNVMGNRLIGATVVYDEQEIFYDVGVHLQSSQRGRADDSRVGFTIRFHPDHLFRGVHDSVTIDRSGGYSGVGGDHDEIILKHAINHAGGLPGMYDDLVRFIAPRSQHTGTGLMLMAKYNDEFLDTQYVDGSDGGQFKLELIYYPLTTVDGNPQSAKLPQPDNVLGTDIRDLGDDEEVYRWNFLIENNRDRDDYAPLIALAKAFSLPGATLDAATQQLMDVEEWMRAFAMKSLSGDVDTYGHGLPHNLIIYFRPDDGRVLAFLWDADFSWTRPVSAPLIGGDNIGRIISLPNNRRLYYGHLNDLITTTFNTTYMAPWTAHYAGLVGQNYSGVLNYIGQRANYVRSQFPAQVPFAITTNGGQDFMVTTPSTTLAGTGWINLKRILVDGRPEPIQFNWPTLTSWQATVPLILGNNRLTFLAYDFQGNLVGSNAVTVTSTAVGGALDSDADGIPDIWERDNGLNPFFNDAAFDYDADGLLNWQEYLSGSHPFDPLSSLQLDAARVPDGIRLAFQAVAGRSYTVQYRDALAGGPWTRLVDVAPQSTNRIVELNDPASAGSAERFYRLTTPQLP
ncbi:MAG TPA: lamin tail domain-containing protein, partial [Verrucomicrobiae bacterium]|nr:lamin tail domain-containing protein [Verrucomicrobiae bacterium]